jgi:hypothetical protein
VYHCKTALRIQSTNFHLVELDRRIRSMFGFPPNIIAQTWNLIAENNKTPEGCLFKHLLWALAYLKLYLPYDCYAGIFNTCVATYRKWVWALLETISGLNVVGPIVPQTLYLYIYIYIVQYIYILISTILINIYILRASFILFTLCLYPVPKIRWNNRYVGDNGSTCLITLDGTDCPIEEPQPFHRRWFSHKFKGPGVRYEVGVCIQTGYIVWKNGPYPCGKYPDLTIARDRIIHYLDPGEKFVADGGYRDGGIYAETPNGLNNDDQRMKRLARARHETVNKRLKQFAVLNSAFRNELEKHYYCFHSIANMTQLHIQTNAPLFQVKYDENLLAQMYYDDLYLYWADRP